MNRDSFLIRLFAVVILYSISFFTVGQSNKWFGQVAAHVATDAEVVFVGPAFSGGVGYYLGKCQVAAGYTYFGAKLSDPTAKLTTHTLKLVGSYNFQNLFEPAKGFYAGLGAGIQFRYEDPEVIKEDSYGLAIFNIGYRFPVKVKNKKRSLGIDLEAMGPYTEKSATGNYTEVLTQLMFGFKFQY
jgi:hypothetical protein